MKKIAIPLLGILITLGVWFTAGVQLTSAQKPAIPPAIVPQATYIPSAGDQTLLVVLVEFPDQAGLFTGIAWEEVFFGSGTGSFSDYYREVSYDKLRYSGDVVGLNGSGVPVVNSAGVDYVTLTISGDAIYRSVGGVVLPNQIFLPVVVR